MMLKFTAVTGILVLLAVVIHTPLGLLGKRKPSKPSKRSVQLAARARSLGLEYSHDKKPKSILGKRFFLERKGAFPRRDVIWGRWRGLPVSYADYRHVVAMPNYSTSIDYSVACATLNIEVPYLSVQRKGGIRWLTKRFRNRADDSSSERFSRDFRVKSRDEEFARKLIDADMMAWLLSGNAQLRFEVGGNQLAVWIMNSSGFIDPLLLFDAAVEFAAHIPKAVLDEYSLTARPS